MDVVSYGERLVPVVADLDGQSRDDGSTGEHDTIGADVENLLGGPADDDLTGGEGIRGGVDKGYGDAGDDVLHGGGVKETDRYLLDGGPNTERGDQCVPEYPGTGEMVDCERTGS